MPRWYDRAEEQIEDDYAKGLIDSKEYREQMRDLRRELEDAADDYAANARDEYMGGW